MALQWQGAACQQQEQQLHSNKKSVSICGSSPLWCSHPTRGWQAHSQLPASSRSTSGGEDGRQAEGVAPVCRLPVRMALALHTC